MLGSFPHALVDGDHARAALGNVFTVVWRGETRLSAVAGIEEGVAALLRSFRQVGYLAIVEPGAKLPSAEVRSRIASIFRGRTAEIPLSCLVIEGTGLRVAAARSVVTAISLVAPAELQAKVVARVDEGVRLLSERLPKDEPGVLTREQLLTSVAELRQLPIGAA